MKKKKEGVSRNMGEELRNTEIASSRSSLELDEVFLVHEAGITRVILTDELVNLV